MILEIYLSTRENSFSLLYIIYSCLCTTAGKINEKKLFLYHKHNKLCVGEQKMQHK